ACALAVGRVLRWQDVTDAEVHDRPVRERDDAPGHVLRAVPLLLEELRLAARDDLDRPLAFEEPAGHVHVVGEHVGDGRGVRRTLEDLEHLRPAVVDARGRAEDLAEPSLDDLLLGEHPTPVVTPRVTDPDVDSLAIRRGHDAVSLVEAEREWLL